jgi:hypothetical protein
MKSINELHKALVEFSEREETHPDYKVDVIPTTISDIRAIYKGWSDKFGKLVGYIFNSTWNRKPNLERPDVRKDKLGYAIRIGCGISSPNQIPISLIASKVVKYLNFLLKDRGHLLQTLCVLYSQKMWNVIELSQVIKTEKKELNDGNSKKSDEDKETALSILTKIEEYIKQVVDELTKKGIKTKAEMKISLEDISDNIPEFNTNINYRKVSIEVKRESIWTHIKEILRLNNYVNKWLDTQKAFLSFWAYCFDSDKNTNYLDDTLEYDNLTAIYRDNDFWNGTTTETYPVLSNCINSYNKNIGEDGAITVPMFLVGIDSSNDDFTKLGEVFTARNEEDYLNIYKNIYNKGITQSEFEEQTSFYQKIASQTYWATFATKIDTLTKKYDNDIYNTANLKHTNIYHSSYGGACILACANIIRKKCDDRTSDIQIQRIVKDFTEKLYQQVVDVCENSTYFANGINSMGHRFEMTILKVYNEMVIINKNEVLSKESLREAHYEQLVNHYGMDINRKFSVVSLTNESYNNPKITFIDFRQAKSTNPKDSGIDLGHKEQTGSWSLENTFLQQSGHNRSSNSGDHTTDNIKWWAWFAEENQKRVESEIGKKYLIETEQYDVIADSKTLVQIFCK